MAVFFLYGCDDKEPVTPGPASTMIGREGGSVATDSGAALEIPPGALETATEISISAFTSETNLSGLSPILGELIGGVEVGPDGTTFSTPVVLTISLMRALEAGEQVPVYYHDLGDPTDEWYPSEYSGWQQIPTLGTVTEDGRSIQVEITHFSTYIVEMSLHGVTQGIVGDLAGSIGDNGLGVDFANYQSWFESQIHGLDAKYIYDLPQGLGYDCYQVVGIEYRLLHDMDAIFENPLLEMKGREGEVAFKYNYEGDRMTREGHQLIYHLFITVYFDRTPPALSLGATETSLDPSDQTTVTGQLMCGEHPMVGQEVSFNADALGSLSEAHSSTDASGNATTTFTAGSEEGTATVSGEYEARRAAETEVVVSSVAIDIGEGPPEPRLEHWSGTFTRTEDITAEGTFYDQHFEWNITVDFAFSWDSSITGHTIIGSGLASQSGSVEILGGPVPWADITVENESFPTLQFDHIEVGISLISGEYYLTTIRFYLAEGDTTTDLWSYDIVHHSVEGTDPYVVPYSIQRLGTSHNVSLAPGQTSWVLSRTSGGTHLGVGQSDETLSLTQDSVE